ncbi:hypothetical protein [Rhizobium phaseoli]|nr:hypothetical protein [Rhizobium phaseoli]
MRSKILEIHEIESILKEAIEARLQEKRAMLMAGVPDEYLSNLEKNDVPGDQLHLDLLAMNLTTEPLVEGTVPLEQWLKNAAFKTGLFPKRKKFFSGFAEKVDRIVRGGVVAEDPFPEKETPSDSTPASILTPLAASLLVLLKKMAVGNARLHRIYVRSLPNPMRELGNVSIERWLEDLVDSRRRTESFPSPLIEFAERLARELKDEKLKNWVCDATCDALNERASLYNALEAEALANLPKAALFLEFGDTKTDGTTELSWWIHAPDPDLCSTRDVVVVNGDLSIQVARLLPSILAQAEEKVGHRFDLIVSLVVPDRLLSSDLESVIIKPELDGLVADPMPLNGLYPVTLHWSRRAKSKAGGAGGPINSWRKALTTLIPRMEAGGSAMAEWLEKSDCDDGYQRFVEVTDRLLVAHGTAVWVGLGHLEMNINRAAAEIVGCLKAGVPCFFWLSQSPTPAVEADIRGHLYDMFKALKASDAPLRIGKLRKAAKNDDLVSSIHIVWDMPDHLPAAQMLESPI